MLCAPSARMPKHARGGTRARSHDYHTHTHTHTTLAHLWGRAHEIRVVGEVEKLQRRQLADVGRQVDKPVIHRRQHLKLGHKSHGGREGAEAVVVEAEVGDGHERRDALGDHQQAGWYPCARHWVVVAAAAAAAAVAVAVARTRTRAASAIVAVTFLFPLLTRNCSCC